MKGILNHESKMYDIQMNLNSQNPKSDKCLLFILWFKSMIKVSRHKIKSVHHTHNPDKTLSHSSLL